MVRFISLIAHLHSGEDEELDTCDASCLLSHLKLEELNLNVFANNCHFCGKTQLLESEGGKIQST